jgi:DNA-binding Xre family transcriptional regulator
MVYFKLKELLTQQNISTYRLSKLTGISEHNLARIRENQITQIELATLEKIYKALELNSIDELIEYIPDEEPDEPAK